MGQEGIYFDLLDWLDHQTRLEPSIFLQKLQAAYRTGPIVYIDGAFGADRVKLQRLVHSRPADAARVTRLLGDRPLRDQLDSLFAELEPVQLDLTLIAASRPSHQEPTGRDSPAADIGYPLLARPGRRACLLVAAVTDPAHLLDWRRENDRDFWSLAARFHAMMAQASPPQPRRRLASKLLTPRECETLAWIAAGKSYWEAAIILGISERTVRYFMANARNKLDVVNNAQAVAEAVWLGLIPRLAERPVH
ncbi:helix-turn-helix transcriptional regulator [Rhizobium glycinendophyticum]|uniref:Helix-turn-helix transcriptional regulator n=1 Tax=Rhizobium glycinendophyticum TaxID=2589807 RepID=A0A504UCC0_9HYPH|nr:helix-turn-helix domain-containing protein [Rhizobium glycinendophyticum]TPP11327.1 helix-turn-helix transcriptional regulator [Rhizobium glycinendophyticum]